MNKRIEALKALATKEVWSENQYNGAPEHDGYELDADMFAELIVLEMCSLMEQCQDDCDTGDASETNWGYISQLQDWIDRFKRHFGLEQ